MIRNETEYQEAVRRLEAERARMREHADRLAKEGLVPDEAKRVLDPMRSFHEQLVEEVESYERLKRGDLGEISNLHGLGRLLVGARIALGMSQRDLAELLEVHESQVSRDERNEYHGITVERASRILEALGIDLKSSVASPVLPRNRPEKQPV
jgi:hypothetical protein